MVDRAVLTRTVTNMTTTSIRIPSAQLPRELRLDLLTDTMTLAIIETGAPLRDHWCDWTPNEEATLSRIAAAVQANGWYVSYAQLWDDYHVGPFHAMRLKMQVWEALRERAALRQLGDEVRHLLRVFTTTALQAGVLPSESV